MIICACRATCVDTVFLYFILCVSCFILFIYLVFIYLWYYYGTIVRTLSWYNFLWVN